MCFAHPCNRNCSYESIFCRVGCVLRSNHTPFAPVRILHGGFLFPRAASQVCMQACIFGSLQAQNPLDLAHDLSVKFQGGQFYVRDDPEQAHEAGEYSQQ